MNRALHKQFKYCFFICLMLAAFLPTKAQFVTIPDATFVSWLNNNGFSQCMNGNQLDISCPAVQTTTSLDIGFNSIQTIEGVEYFPNLTSLTVNSTGIDSVPYISRLTYLDCIGNALTGFSQLPDGLLYLNCSNNQVQSLPDNLPPGMQTLVCETNPLTDLPALPNSLLNLDISFTELLNFPTLPASLQVFTCAECSIVNMPALPSALVALDCQNNPYLVSLPSLPVTLRTINCEYDGLTSLPALPDSLRALYCSENEIDSLPTLPPFLDTLDCYVNLISQLPALAQPLEYLDCSSNLLDWLPALPSSLLFLSCSQNSLPGLPALPNTLQYLDCSNNHVTGLASLPPALQYLACGYNLIPFLSALPATLQYLDCSGNNHITVIPPLPTDLQNLLCNADSLTVLPSLPASLGQLICNNNFLSSLPNLPAGLWELNCNNNRLTTLPVLPASLSYLQCNDNYLSSLPPLPNVMQFLNCSSNPGLTCLPEIKSISQLYFDSTAVTCLPDYGIVGTSTPALNTLPLCGIFNPTGCQIFWNISGRDFYDANSDCQFDSNDVAVSNVKVTLDSAGAVQQQVYSGGEGFYSFQTLHGNYTVHVDTGNLPFTLRCPAGDLIEATVSAADSLLYSEDFAFKCRTTGFDIGVQSILNNYVLPSPGSIFEVSTIAGDMSQIYGAHCAAGISGRVQIIFSGPITYQGTPNGALTPVVHNDTLAYNIADFGAINDYAAFNTFFQVNNNAIANTSICFTVLVTPVSGDNNPSNNAATFCMQVKNAHDPNEKDVYPTSVDSAGQWLTYTIRFQNTGNAPAVNIIVRDTLSSNLNPSTFQLLAYSAPNLTQVMGNVVVFNFPNINLPDSAAGDSVSTGYVQFRIQTISNLQAGDVISNTASIYFDLNPAVVTNTVSDTVQNSVACVPNGSAVSDTICSGDTLYMWNKEYAIAGNYADTLTNVGGCDSITTLSLTVNSVVHTTITDTICDSIVFNGRTYKQSGTYYDTLQTVNGCDSSVILTLSFFPHFQIPVSNLGDTLKAYDASAFQWYFEDTLIPGATDSILIITQSDGYAVEVTDTSGCTVYQEIMIIYEGIQQINPNNALSLYPNPANNLLYIKTEGLHPQTITIYDVDGQAVLTQAFTPELDIHNLSAGVYLLEVNSMEGVARKRWVKSSE